MNEKFCTASIQPRNASPCQPVQDSKGARPVEIAVRSIEELHEVRGKLIVELMERLAAVLSPEWAMAATFEDDSRESPLADRLRRIAIGAAEQNNYLAMILSRIEV